MKIGLQDVRRAIKVNALAQSATKIRQIARELRDAAPSLAVKLDAIASDAEIRATNAERGISP